MTASVADERDWREVLLERVLVVTTPIVAVVVVIRISTSTGLDVWLLAACVPLTLWSAAAIFVRSWPFAVRTIAMLSPLVLGVCIVYARVGYKGNASALATVVVLLTGLLLGRQAVWLVVVAFFLLAVAAGTAMTLDVMPWPSMRVPRMDRASLWIRATATALLCWSVAGGTVVFVVERVERSLRETREALATVLKEQRHREQLDPDPE